MIFADEALRLVLASVGPLPAEEAPLDEVVGRVLAEDLFARRPLPEFDHSAMDGFAVRSGDCAAGAILALARGARGNGRARGAGRAGGPAAGPVGSGEAARIMTGAPIPAGADAVVMKELARELPGGVEVLRPPRPGENIRRAGEDIRAGEPLLREGAVLRPYEVALLAASGIARVRVPRRAAVGVVPTGDELLGAVAAGSIPDAVGPALCAAVRRWGAQPRAAAPVPDERERLSAALGDGLERSDLLLVSGGVSTGDYDLTRPVLAELGVEQVFWQVAIKPGKPLFFGLWRGKPVFALPGNPVAALVCLEEFVRPAVEALSGRRAGHPSYHLRGVLENGYPKDPCRRQYLFCAASGETGSFRLAVLRPQGAAMTGMACRADALAVSREGGPELRPGTEVAFRWLK